MKHPFQSAVANGGNAALVQPSNWNDVHIISWRSISSGYSAQESDDGILITTASAIALPAASAQSGQTYIIKHGPNTGAGVSGITPNGTDTIDGVTGSNAWELVNANQFVILSSDGVSNWMVVGGN